MSNVLPETKLLLIAEASKKYRRLDGQDAGEMKILVNFQIPSVKKSVKMFCMVPGLGYHGKIMKIWCKIMPKILQNT